MAEGVKGLLIARRLSLVVCALTSFAASLRTRSGFGGLSIGFAMSEVDVLVDGVSDVTNWFRRASVEVMRSLRVRISVALVGGILAVVLIFIFGVRRCVQVKGRVKVIMLSLAEDPTIHMSPQTV